MIIAFLLCLIIAIYDHLNIFQNLLDRMIIGWIIIATFFIEKVINSIIIIYPVLYPVI